MPDNRCDKKPETAIDVSYQASAISTPNVAKLHELFCTQYRFSKGVIERTRSTFGITWAADFEQVLASLFPDDQSLAMAAKGYAAFAIDSMRRQKAFESTGEYPNKTYAEAASEVYFNEDHMSQEYLPGLLISHYLWPHHYRQIRFFDIAFLDLISRSATPIFVEIGIGTALYSRRILEHVANANGTGYDISPSSCRYAEKHMHAIGAANRYHVHCSDIIAKPIAPVPWLVCVEVLEHLEDPGSFLRTLRAALTKGGRAFITAAINAAHADHIYLYRGMHEIEKQLIEAGFTIEQSFSATAFAPPSPGTPVPTAAAFVVCSS